MGIVKKATKALGLSPDVPRMETKIPAQQLERQEEVGADEIQLGQEEDTKGAKGKRGLVRPVASSLKV